MDGSRRALVLVAVFTFVASFLLMGDARPAYAKADCNQKDPMADISVTQTISSTWLKQVTLTNLGPCNAPDVVLVDTLPAGSTVAGAIVTNPSSWSCSYDNTAVPVQVRCVTTSTMGVPGTSTFSIPITAPTSPDWTDLAQALVGGSTVNAGCGDGNASTTCDPATANNSNWTGALTNDGGSIDACADARSTCVQNTNISVPNSGTGGSVVIQNLSDAKTTCATISGFPSCFGTLVSIQAPAVHGAIKTFTIAASLTNKSYGNVNLINSTDGSTWAIVPTCKSTPTTYPCVLSKSKFKDASGATFYVFEALTQNDDSWGWE